MSVPTDTPGSQVCKADSGQFIAFWQGQIVHKLDGGLRYFETEQAAWNFLARRDLVSAAWLALGRGGEPAGISLPFVTDRALGSAGRTLGIG
jgi:hypothetical protein